MADRDSAGRDEEPDEILVAQAITAVSSWGVGRSFGQPVLNDDGSSDSMFDVRFDSIDPPVALEVWSAVDHLFVEGGRAAMKAVTRLRDAAVDANRGRWVFSVVAGTRIKSALPVMIDIVSGESPSTHLPEGVLADHHASGTPDASIVTMTAGSAISMHGLGHDLLIAIDDNAEKLSLATGFERHLAVDVLGLRAHDPSSTFIPELPSEIDFLWVVRRTIPGPVVWVTNGPDPWRVNGDPYFNTDLPPLEHR